MSTFRYSSIQVHGRNRGYLRLAISTRLMPDRRCYIALGPNTPENITRGEAIAALIDADVKLGRFDATLKRYHITPPASLKADPKFSAEASADPEFCTVWAAFCKERLPTLRPGTARNYNMVTSKLNAAPQAFKISESKALISWAKASFTTTVAKNFLQSLNAAVKWAIATCYITGISQSPLMYYSSFFPPTKANKGREPVKIITGEEFIAIVAAFERAGERAKCYIPYIKFLRLTGARPSEATGLNWGDVEMSEERIVFRRAYVESVAGHALVSGLKTQKIRLFPITKEIRKLLEELQPYPSLLDARQLPVFRTIHGHRIKAKYFREKYWQPLIVEGLELKVNPYHLRHSFITEQLARGAEVADVAALVGNSSKTIWEHYAAPARNLEVR